MADGKTAAGMQLTAELVALVERMEADPGPHPGCSEPSDADFDAMTEKLLAAHQPQPLWLFAYGSLIWKPAFDVVETRHGIVAGWHRTFCMTLTRWRGTRDCPGLMMALDRGGSCAGLAYRLPDEDHRGQIDRLLRREIGHVPNTNTARWLTVRTAEGPVKALAFVAAPDGPTYVGRQSLEEVAKVLAKAAGHIGSSAHYLYATVQHLEAHGIRDRNLWRLQQLVAAEIRAANGGAR